ncbi:MAG: hypothetical protein ABUK01_02540 [Leptospirales bacterium]
MKKIAIILALTLTFITTNLFSSVVIEQSVTGTTQGTLSNGGSAANLTITGYVFLAISAIGAVILTVASVKNMNNVELAEQQVVYFLKANHTTLTKEFSQSEGYFFQDIASMSGMTRNEANILSNEFEGSVQQKRMLEILSHPIDGNSARGFVRNLGTYMLEHLGMNRVIDISSRHLAAP